ncbi:GNAT family N-acetyltransferase [bacterium]|nr:GNAT family N-acetyltransferase [bacterium]
MNTKKPLMIFRTERVAPDEVAFLKIAYLKLITAPLDGMWESGFIPLSTHWVILHDNDKVGYYCINSEKALLQFYLPDELWHEAPVFLQKLISMGQIESAFTGTNEPGTMSICMDLQKSTKCHTLLFEDRLPVLPQLKDWDRSNLRLSEYNEIPRLINFIEENTGTSGAWLQAYLGNLITRGESYILERDNVIWGTGECRNSDSQPPFIDLGMIVAKEYRSCGVATLILSLMKQICYRRQQIPICSTTINNIAAQKAIERAGFISKNRILHIRF